MGRLDPIHQLCHKHGINHERSSCVTEHCGLTFADESGHSNDLLVIHSMKMRAHYRQRYTEALSWPTTP